VYGQGIEVALNVVQGVEVSLCLVQSIEVAWGFIQCLGFEPSRFISIEHVGHLVITDYTYKYFYGLYQGNADNRNAAPNDVIQSISADAR
jgi:hypothetical protein